MKAGDLVKYYWPKFLGKMDESFDKGMGTVLSVRVWKDPGAPDRNCGVSVTVAWDTGIIEEIEDDELEVIMYANDA